jgi:hypothetical protein
MRSLLLLVIALLPGCALIDGLKGQKDNNNDGGFFNGNDGGTNTGDFCFTLQDPQISAGGVNGGCDFNLTTVVLTGETRVIHLYAFQNGSGGNDAIRLSLKKMDTGTASASLGGTSLPRSGGVELTIVGGSQAGQTGFSLTGTSNAGMNGATLSVAVLDRGFFSGLIGDDLAFAPSGRLGLAVDCYNGMTSSAIHRLVQIDPLELRATKTILSWFEPRSGNYQQSDSCPSALLIEPDEMHALVGIDGLRRVALDTGAVEKVGSFDGLPMRIIRDTNGLTVLSVNAPMNNMGGQINTVTELQRASADASPPVTTLATSLDVEDIALESGGTSGIGVPLFNPSAMMTTPERLSWQGGSASTQMLGTGIDGGPGARIIRSPDGTYFLTSRLIRIDAATRALSSILGFSPTNGSGGAVAFNGTEIITEVSFANQGSPTQPSGLHQSAFLERVVQSPVIDTLARFKDSLGAITIAGDKAYISKDGGFLNAVDIATGQTSTIALHESAGPMGPPIGGRFARMLPAPDGTILALNQGSPGSLLRIDPSTGNVTTITNLNQPSDMAQQVSDPQHVLIVDSQYGKLYRVGLSDMLSSVVAGSFPGSNMYNLQSIAVEPNDQKALVSGSNTGIYEVDLTSGAVQLIYQGRGGSRLAISSDGAFVAILDNGIAVLDLQKFTRTRLPTTGGPVDIALEAGDATLLLNEVQYSFSGHPPSLVERLHLH